MLHFGPEIEVLERISDRIDRVFAMLSSSYRGPTPRAHHVEIESGRKDGFAAGDDHHRPIGFSAIERLVDLPKHRW